MVRPAVVMLLGMLAGPACSKSGNREPPQAASSARAIAAACVPGEVKCLDQDTLITCDAEGGVHQTKCEMGCHDEIPPRSRAHGGENLPAAYCGLCVPGTCKCTPDGQVEYCRDAGFYRTARVCDSKNSGLACSQNRCPEGAEIFCSPS